MEHLEMVEKLVEKTGVTYQEARDVLEKTDWNLLDALIALEKEGRTQYAGGSYSTASAREKAAGTERKDASDASTFGDLMARFWAWIKRLFHRGNINQLCMERDGEQLLRIPVTLFVALLLFAFWVVLPLMIVALFCKCRFLFRGPDLGTDAVNGAMGKVSDAADTLKAEFRSEAAKHNG